MISVRTARSIAGKKRPVQKPVSIPEGKRPVSNLKGRNRMGLKMVRCKSCIKFKDRSCLETGEKRSGGRHRVCTEFEPRIEARRSLPYRPWDWKERRKKEAAERKKGLTKLKELEAEVETTPGQSVPEIIEVPKNKEKEQRTERLKGLWNTIFKKGGGSRGTRVFK